MERARAFITFRAAFAALAIAFVISTVIPGGSTLQCLGCTGDSPSNCTGSVQNCTSWQGVCVAKYYNLTKLGSEKSIFTITCGRSSECNSTYSMTVPTMREEQNVTCCQTDRCVPDTPSVPSTTAEPNGLLCESCHSKYSPSCRNPGVMECSGMENKCLNLVVKVTSGFQTNRSEISGCASESYCRNSPVLKSGGVTVRIEVNCTGPGAGNDTTTSPTTGSSTSSSNGSTPITGVTTKPSITATMDKNTTTIPNNNNTGTSDSMQTNARTSMHPNLSPTITKKNRTSSTVSHSTSAITNARSNVSTSRPSFTMQSLTSTSIRTNSNTETQFTTSFNAGTSSRATTIASTISTIRTSTSSSSTTRHNTHLQTSFNTSSSYAPSTSKILNNRTSTATINITILETSNSSSTFGGTSELHREHGLVFQSLTGLLLLMLFS